MGSSVHSLGRRRALLGWAFASFAVNLGFARFSYGLLLPALHHTLGDTYAALGASNAVNFAGYLAGTISVPWVLRYQRARGALFIVSTGMVGLTLAFAASAPDIVALTAWRALMGYASAIAIALTSIETFERIAPERRGLASSVMWSGLALGLPISAPALPLTLGVAPLLSWRIVWLLMAASAPIVAIGFAAAARRLPTLTPAPSSVACTERFDWLDNLRPTRFLFLNLSYVGFGIAYVAYATYAIALFTSRGLPTVGVGAVWAVVGLASTAGTLAIGTVLDTRLGRFAAALALALGALGSLLAVGPTLPWAFASAVCLGLGGWTAPPAAFTAFARRRTSAQTYPAAYASITTALALGQFVGPLIGSAVVVRGGLVAATTLGAGIYALASLSAVLDAVIAARVTSPTAKNDSIVSGDRRIERGAVGRGDTDGPKLASVVLDA